MFTFPLAKFANATRHHEKIFDIWRASPDVNSNLRCVDIVDVDDTSEFQSGCKMPLMQMFKYGDVRRCPKVWTRCPQMSKNVKQMSKKCGADVRRCPKCRCL